MLSGNTIAARELLRALFTTAEPRDWRLRKVLQITPLTHDSYRARTSFQFLLQSRFFKGAWDRAFNETPNPPDAPDDEAEIVLPIDWLPKYVLLNFSLEGPDGKSLSLFTSGATSAISTEMFRVSMETLDTRAADGRTTAHEFFTANRDVITCMIWTGQNEVVRALDAYGWRSRKTPSRTQFHRAMCGVYAKAAEQVGGDVLAAYGFSAAIAARCDELYAAIDDTSTALGVDRTGQPYWSPFHNPALLIRDLLRVRGITRPLREHAIEFLDKTLAFLNSIAALEADAFRLLTIVRALEKFAHEYPAYARVKVPLDRDFMIKIDQVIPMEMKWWQRYTGALRYQNYPVEAGGARSTHIEVTCEHPIELEQRPSRTRIIVGRQTLPIDEIFSVGSHSTPYYQHFYTNRSAADMRAAIERRAGESSEMAQLQVHYTVERGTIYGYRLVSLLAFAAAAVFARLYDPEKFSPGQLQLVALIPFLSGFLGALSALRPQENIVAIRVQKYKYFVLGAVTLTALHFLAGLIYPSWPQTFRDVVGAVPLFGRLVVPAAPDLPTDAQLLLR
jgi:hypothetical protein